LIDSAVNDLIGDGGLYMTWKILSDGITTSNTGQVGGPEFLKTMLTIGKLNNGKEPG